jgi:hypothetical protein
VAPSNLGTTTSSFNIPLSSGPKEVIYVPSGKEAEFEAKCPGNAFAPAAVEGYVCFFGFGNELGVNGAFGLPQGAILTLGPKEIGENVVGKEEAGTWAVTAE